MHCCHSNVDHLNRPRVGIAPGHPALTTAIPWHVAGSLLPNTHLHWACTHHTMSKQPQSCIVTPPLTQSVHMQASRAGQIAYTQWTKQQRSCVDAVSTVQKATCGSVLECGALSGKFSFGVQDFQACSSLRTRMVHKTHSNLLLTSKLRSEEAAADATVTASRDLITWA
jgi:hypothetical protein